LQTWFIGAGAVLGSLLPALFTALGIANTAPEGVVPDSVRLSFTIGAAAMVLAVAWTALSVREYSPAELAAFAGSDAAQTGKAHEPLVYSARGPVWLALGAGLLGLVSQLGLDKQLYVLGGGLACFGIAQMVNRATRANGALAQILSDMAQMPPQMRQLALAQFFTWTALFILWIYTTPVVTQRAFGATDTASAAYNAGADWVGVMFAFYNGVAAIAAFLLPVLARSCSAMVTTRFMKAACASWCVAARISCAGARWNRPRLAQRLGLTISARGG